MNIFQFKAIYKLPLLILIISLYSCQHKPPHADLVVFNADIWTGNSNQPSAQAMAIKDNKILAIGSNCDIEIYSKTSLKTIDAKGQFISPGFIDSHVHLLDGGFTLASVQLRNAKSPQEFSQRIGDYAKT
jgi:predicted amidohydrolase YtcJ